MHRQLIRWLSAGCCKRVPGREISQRCKAESRHKASTGGCSRDGRIPLIAANAAAQTHGQAQSSPQVKGRTQIRWGIERRHCDTEVSSVSFRRWDHWTAREEAMSWQVPHLCCMDPEGSLALLGLVGLAGSRGLTHSLRLQLLF